AGVDHLRVPDRPLERLHPAERAAAGRQDPPDAEVVEDELLGPDHVADRHDREVDVVATAAARLDRARPGRAAAGAEHLDTGDEVAVGAERLAGPDHAVPPADAAAPAAAGAEAVDRAGRALLADPGRVRVAGQRVAGQDHVGAVRVEPSVALV